MSYKWINKNLERTYGFNIEKFNSDDNRFHAIYFLDNVSGSLLLSKKYTDNTKFSSHEDLISGFLNALNLFISEIKPESINDEIQEVKVERVILHQIMEDFYYRFESAIRNFNGNIDPSILQYKKRLDNMNLNTLFRFDVQL